MNLYKIRNKILSGVPMQDLNLRVVFYARVSTDKDEQLHSLKAQVSFFNDYISKNPNWELIDSYIDEGISGTRVNKREEFLRMIEDSKNDKFDIILTKEISRFSRNTLDSIKYTQELLNNGVGVLFLNDNINTILPDSELRLTIMASVAQDEVRKLSERVSFGMKRGVENGVVHGCSNIYGYVKDKGKLVIDEREAEIVRIIYEKYASEPGGAGQVTRYINSLGFKNQVGKEFQTNTILRILKNPKYKGYFCENKTKTIDYRTKKKIKLSKDEWVMYKDEDKVPPIVSEELWNRVQNKLKEHEQIFSSKNKNKKIYQNRYTYSAKIFCSEHNATYHRSASGSRKNNPVWECSEYRKNGIKGCTNPRLLNSELDLLFKDLFKSILKNKTNITNDLISECKNYIDLQNDDKETNILESKLNLINNKKQKLLELVLDNFLDKEDYKKQVNLLNKEYDEIEERLKEFNLSKMNENIVNNKINYIKKSINAALNDENCFSNCFDTLISKVLVSKGDLKNKINLEVYLKTGDILNVQSDIFGKEYHCYNSNTTNNSGKCSN